MKKATHHSLTLEKAFESTFHLKYDFHDFLDLQIESEYEYFNIHTKKILRPSTKLGKYLRFLNSFVFEFADVNDSVVHSYRRGKNTYSAIVKHADSNYFFKTDIQDFFYSITTEDIKSILDRNLDNTPISDIGDHKDCILRLVSINNTLPVGLPTSPTISNTFLYAFDNMLESYCQENDIVYTRYSDDIILSSGERGRLDNISTIISGYLKEYASSELELNPSKTKYTHKGNKVKLLGIVILPCGLVTIDAKEKKQLEILLHFYSNDKEKYFNYLKKHFNSKSSTVSGKLNYISTIDKLYLNKLRKKYGNFTVDYFYNNPAE
ncbi:MAG: reverse transcriptase family protein [Candidatus Thiodiazotropha sp. (ex Lucinoma borealis)]|nr:reverse transcriptase family protein [Candidatus Thiodiazotropha sp. (ex Lucinoma borealis)]MCU7856887.1 reverse transcriptase family protein [Candidatus Thiodiazotropha sp. (ex Lucinoma borealis)]MCU7869338.1 reverse transcriptase family protein [Candidatus Thiodiazotropha sp. (ex Lucinoma borealis)]